MTTTSTPRATYSNMTFGAAIASVFRKYAIFRGRATRSEYWWFMLFTYIWSFVVQMIVMIVMLPSLSSISGTLAKQTTNQLSSSDVVAFETRLIQAMLPAYAVMLVLLLPLFLPSFAVLVRRLQDTNRSGWMVLIVLVPLVGSIVLLVFTLLPSYPRNNPWGTAPVPWNTRSLPTQTIE